MRSVASGATRAAIELCLYYLFAACIPDSYALVEVREVGQVASDGGVVAEDFVFYYRLPRAHGVVEVGLVIDRVAVAVGNGVGFALLFEPSSAALWARDAPRATSPDTGRADPSAIRRSSSPRARAARSADVKVRVESLMIIVPFLP